MESEIPRSGELRQAPTSASTEHRHRAAEDARSQDRRRGGARGP